MRRLIAALLEYLPLDDAYVLRALGDKNSRGLKLIEEICTSEFTHQVTSRTVKQECHPHKRAACSMNMTNIV